MIEKPGVYLKKYSVHLTAIASLIVILSSFWYIPRYLFSGNDCECIFTIEEARWPYSLSTQITEATKVIDTGMVSLLLRNKVVTILNDFTRFVRNTNSVGKYEIRNNSKYTLRSIEIRIMNVNNLTGWSIDSKSFLSSELEELKRKLNYDQQTSMVVLPKISVLPPGSSLVVSLWGDIMPQFIDDAILVTYEGGSAKVYRKEVVTAYNSFIINNMRELIILLIILNIGLFLFFIDRYVKKSRTKRIRPR